MARADLDKRPADVAAMFDAIAGRYDLLNDILSAGQVRLWRRAGARIPAAGLGERVLALAAGTGTSSLTFTATGADAVACDFSLGMLRAGRSRRSDDARRDGRGRLGFVAVVALPAPGADAVACDFSLGMLRAGRSRRSDDARRDGRGRLGFVAGDALRLPFRDEAFDAVTISFGLR